MLDVKTDTRASLYFVIPGVKPAMTGFSIDCAVEGPEDVRQQVLSLLAALNAAGDAWVATEQAKSPFIPEEKS